MSNNGQNAWTEEMVRHSVYKDPQFANAIANLLNIQPAMAQELNLLRLVAQKVIESATLPHLPPPIIIPGRQYEDNMQKSMRMLTEAAQLAFRWREWQQAAGIIPREDTNGIQSTD